MELWNFAVTVCEWRTGTYKQLCWGFNSWVRGDGTENELVSNHPQQQVAGILEKQVMEAWNPVDKQWAS